MATFKYISKDMSAKTIRGTLEADDRNDLVRKLKEQNLFLVSCQDVTKKTVNQYKMKLNELSAYSREIGTMLASGLSLIRIFSIMVRREDNKKIKMNKSYGGNLLKQKLINEFINKGYSKEDIISILDSKNLNDNELYNREYEKLYNKYKNKYTGSDLEYFIKQKLYSKGFKKSDL